MERGDPLISPLHPIPRLRGDPETLGFQFFGPQIGVPPLFLRGGANKFNFLKKRRGKKKQISFKMQLRERKRRGEIRGFGGDSRGAGWWHREFLWCHIPWGVSWLRGHPQTGQNWCSRVLGKILETQTGEKKGNFGRFGTHRTGAGKRSPHVPHGAWRDLGRGSNTPQFQYPPIPAPTESGDNTPEGIWAGGGTAHTDPPHSARFEGGSTPHTGPPAPRG